MAVKGPVNPIEELIRQHRSLLRRLEGIKEAASSFRESGFSERLRESVLSSVTAFISDLAAHAHNEETVVFPAYEAAVGEKNKRLAETRTSHHDLSADMEDALTKIQALVKDLAGKPPAEASHLFEELGKNVEFMLKRWAYHAQLEEKYLFPDMLHKLDTRTLAKLAQQMKQTSASG